MAGREPCGDLMYFCGYLTGTFFDGSRLNWDGNGPRPISWSAWYPTDSAPGDADKAKDERRIFLLGDVVEGASPSGDRPVWPVVMLSHGTGGTAEGLGWLGCALARRGYIALAPNHHGNTALEAYKPEGFLCWWERAPDLSLLLTHLAGEGPFAGRLDLARVSAAGFSIGGYTVLTAAGARTSVDRFTEWGRDKGALGSGVREFPDIEERIPDLLENSEPFRRALERQGDDLGDARFKSIVAMAPAPPVRGFSEESVAGITVPVHIITSGADDIAPRADCADWLKALNPAFKLTSVGDQVGHYTFLGPGSRLGRRLSPDVFTDKVGVDRAEVHARIVDLVVADLV